MKEDGFSLVELIGVLVVLSLVALIAVPAILSAMRKTEEKVNEDTVLLLGANARSAVSQHCNESGKIQGKTYVIPVQYLVDNAYTKMPISHVKESEGEKILKEKAVSIKYNNNKFEDATLVNCGTCASPTPSDVCEW